MRPIKLSKVAKARTDRFRAWCARTATASDQVVFRRLFAIESPKIELDVLKATGIHRLPFYDLTLLAQRWPKDRVKNKTAKGTR